MVDYSTIEGNWNWGHLDQVLPNDCLDILLPMNAPTQAARLDCVAWLPNIMVNLTSNMPIVCGLT